MKFKKRLMVFVLLFCSVWWFAVPQIAKADEGIMPLDLYTKYLRISGNVDVVTGELSAEVGVKTSETCEIYTTMDIYKRVDGEWQFEKSFRNPRSGVFTGMNKTYGDSCKVEKGYDYKIVATAYVKSVADQVSETITQDSRILSYR